MFDFGGSNGKSSISKITLNGDNKVNQHAIKVEKDILEFAACSGTTPLSFWVRTDTFGHVAMGTGGKPGDVTLLQWTDPAPIKWVYHVGVGQVDASNEYKVHFTNIEVNRGYKHEVYCTPTNDEEDPDADGYDDLGYCYRKMPDSYLHNALFTPIIANPQNAPQLRCNQGNTLDANHDACISGICRDYGVGVLRCTGCNSDKDCQERTYSGTDCQKGVRVVVKRDNKWYGAEVKGMDRGGQGVPGNGYLNVWVDALSTTFAQARETVFACPNLPENYQSSIKPTVCDTSCAISGILCPLQKPTGCGTLNHPFVCDLSPSKCWDGSNLKGNRGVCVFEERDMEKWGPRKYFCSQKGAQGAWCKTLEHCNSGFCYVGRCQDPCTTDNHSRCGNGRYCDIFVCKNKEANGVPTVHGPVACQSGIKALLTCAECNTNNHDKCGSGRYCDNSICKNKEANGVFTTHGPVACQSNIKAGAECAQCNTNDHSTCGSGRFCDISVCKKTYGWMEPKRAGVCGSNVECSDGLYCDGGKCQWIDGSRKVNEACNRHRSCNGHKFGIVGTLACCEGTCQTLVADHANTGWCPNKCKGTPFAPEGTCHLIKWNQHTKTKVFVNKNLNTGTTCVADANCSSGKYCGKLWTCQPKKEVCESTDEAQVGCGKNSGFARKCKSNWACGGLCANNNKKCSKWLESCIHNTECCSCNCGGYKAGHYENKIGNCLGKCHDNGKSCKGTKKWVDDGYKEVAKNTYEDQFCKDGWIYGKVDVSYQKHIGYKEVAKNTYKDQSCKDGWIYGKVSKSYWCGPWYDVWRKTCYWTKNTYSNCLGNCHPNKKSCRGKAIFAPRTKKKNTLSNCYGNCHPNNKSCRGEAKFKHVGYNEVAKNKFGPNQSCKSGYIYGETWVKEKMGKCSIFNKGKNKGNNK